MINTLIIEDESAALANLTELLQEFNSEVEVKATLGTVEESIQYLQSEPPVHLIFSDVQLSDGLSFSIFEATRTRIPVIFVTGYDQFVMNAFEYNGIDYLLKPVNRQELEKALRKYHQLQEHFGQSTAPLDNLVEYINKKRKTRLIVRKGLENISLRLEDIVLFFTENKVVYVIDSQGKKFMTEKNLGELEKELDPSLFFRVNRQYIVHINYIKGFKSFEKVKLKVDLALPDLAHQIIISQETAPEFRRWIYEA